MTTDELRDNVAEMCELSMHQHDWRIYGSARSCNECGHWEKDAPPVCDRAKHPIDGTLDQLARLWGEYAADRWLLEMEWNRTPEFACKASRYSINNSDSLYEPVYVMVASEYEARLRLFYAILVAEGRKG